MNIFLLGTTHRLLQALQEAGHHVVTCGPGEECDVQISYDSLVPVTDILDQAPACFTPDVLLFMDNSKPLLLSGLEDCPIPTVWYAVDNHLHGPWQSDGAKLFDVVFVAQKDFVTDFREGPVANRVAWLPLFCKSNKDTRLALETQHEVAFVGSIDPKKNPDRTALLERLSKRIPLHCTTGEYVSVFNQSKIVLNQSVKSDVNYRTFEALGCGSFLITEKVGNGQAELFTDRVHLALYESGNIDQLVETVQYYLDHDEERETIAWQGWQEAIGKHTDAHRVQTITDIIAAGDPGQAVTKRKKSRAVLQRYAAKMYTTLLFQYDYEDAAKRLFYTCGTQLIQNAFNHHAAEQNIPEALRDAVVYGELLITNGSLREAVHLMQQAASCTTDPESQECNRLKADLFERIGFAHSLAKNADAAKAALNEAAKYNPEKHAPEDTSQNPEQ